MACLIVIDYFFLEPYFSFAFPSRITIQMFVFTGQNLLLAAMGYSMKSALLRSEAAENKFRLLVEQACELLVLRDEQGKVTYVSPRVRNLFGYTPKEFESQTIDRLFTSQSLLLYEDAGRIVDAPETGLEPT